MPTPDRFFADQELDVLRRVIFKSKIIAPEKVLVLDIQQVGFTSLNFLAQVLEKFKHPAFKYERLSLPTTPGKCPNFMQRGDIGGLSYRDEGGQLKIRSPQEFNDYTFLNGHIPWWPEYAELFNAKGITAVRHPLGINGRVVADANFAYGRGYIKTKAEAEQYIRDFTDNFQTRMIAGKDYMGGTCTEATLNKAIDNIEKHFLLCWTSDADMNRFIEVLASIFGWGNIALPRRTQVSGDKIFSQESDLSPPLQAYIQESNQFDVRLYTYVKARMNAWVLENIETYEEVPFHEPVRCFLASYAKDRIPYEVARKYIVEWNCKVDSELLETEQDWPDNYDDIQPQNVLPKIGMSFAKRFKLFCTIIDQKNNNIAYWTSKPDQERSIEEMMQLMPAVDINHLNKELLLSSYNLNFMYVDLVYTLMMPLFRAPIFDIVLEYLRDRKMMISANNLNPESTFTPVSMFEVFSFQPCEDHELQSELEVHMILESAAFQYLSINFTKFLDRLRAALIKYEALAKDADKQSCDIAAKIVTRTEYHDDIILRRRVLNPNKQLDVFRERVTSICKQADEGSVVYVSIGADRMPPWYRQLSPFEKVGSSWIWYNNREVYGDDLHCLHLNLDHAAYYLSDTELDAKVHLVGAANVLNRSYSPFWKNISQYGYRSIDLFEPLELLLATGAKVVLGIFFDNNFIKHIYPVFASLMAQYPHTFFVTNGACDEPVHLYQPGKRNPAVEEQTRLMLLSFRDWNQNHSWIKKLCDQENARQEHTRYVLSIT